MSCPMEYDEGSPPLWLRPGGSFRRPPNRGSLAGAIGSSAVVVLLLAAALALVFIVVPSVLSAASQIFRPHAVKKSWDSLNLVLVLFAILCGFLSRNARGNESSYGESRSFSSRTSLKSCPSTPRDQWFGYSDQVAYERPSSLIRLQSSTSYPDLRQKPHWAQADDHKRFLDDTNIYRSRRWRDDEEVVVTKGNGDYCYGGTTEIKTIQVDTVEVQEMEVPVSDTPPQPPSPAPPESAPPLQQVTASSLPPPPSSFSAPLRAAKGRPKAKRTSEAHVEIHGELSPPKEESMKVIETYKLPPPSPPPPPPPQDFDYYATPRIDKSERKRAGSVTKDFIKSLGRKKKRQRQKSMENLDSLLPVSSQPQHRPPPTPPPPPPRPLYSPPSVFHNLFSSKKGKSRKDHPPPPPPPPSSRVKKTRLPAANSQPCPTRPVAKERPPALKNPIPYNNSIYSGNGSPLIPIPPPPPPPFRVPDWKFSVRGGYVRIRSSGTSRGSSPDPMEDGQATPGTEMSPLSPSAAYASDASEPSSPAILCPSPDVDTKADNFIARFRAGLQLEKMNSMKRRTRSNLCPDPEPGP